MKKTNYDPDFDSINEFPQSVGMTITIKFRIGQTVFFMKDNKVSSGTITGFRITSTGGNEVCIFYSVRLTDTNDNFSYHQDVLFSTKEELLKSL